MILPKIGTMLFNLLSLIIFGAAGIAVGFIGAQAWIRLESTGMFVRWQLLDSSQKFLHLTYARQNMVAAQAEDGNYYLYDSGPCDSTAGRKCNEWVESPPGLEFDALTKRIAESGCKSAYDYYTNDSDYRYYVKPRYPPQSEATARECVISLEFHPDGGDTLTYYVLLEDGKVWKWIHKSIAMLYLLTMIRWAFVGLITGVIFWLLLQKIWLRDKSR